MGYVRARKTYRLVFIDEEYAGLEVVARSASVDAYQRIAALATRDYATPPSAEDLAEIDHLYRCFADVLVSWNLEEPVLDEAGDEIKDERGELVVTPVPATFAGLKSQDLPFAVAVIEAWMEAVAGVSRPLASRSTDGAPSVEASLPMDVLSPSR